MSRHLARTAPLLVLVTAAIAWLWCGSFQP